MFIPKRFEISDKDEIDLFIDKNAFGVLISAHEGRLISSHIPFLVSQDRSQLMAHVAKVNPQWQSLAGQEALVILAGPHDYISPSWYSSASVPTWNYQAVHIYGLCEIYTDAGRLKTVVNTLSAKYESGFDNPWQTNYPETMLTAIVGIDITINDIQCQYKLSQNRPAQDRQEIIKQLDLRGSHALAEAMKRNEV